VHNHEQEITAELATAHLQYMGRAGKNIIDNHMRGKHVRGNYARGNYARGNYARDKYEWGNKQWSGVHMYM
jgi:hypothetical protein